MIGVAKGKPDLELCSGCQYLLTYRCRCQPPRCRIGATYGDALCSRTASGSDTDKAQKVGN